MTSRHRGGLARHLLPEAQRGRRQLQTVLAAVAHQHRQRLQPYHAAMRPPADSPCVEELALSWWNQQATSQECERHACDWRSARR